MLLWPDPGSPKSLAADSERPVLLSPTSIKSTSTAAFYTGFFEVMFWFGRFGVLSFLRSYSEVKSSTEDCICEWNMFGKVFFSSFGLVSNFQFHLLVLQYLVRYFGEGLVRERSRNYLWLLLNLTSIWFFIISIWKLPRFGVCWGSFGRFLNDEILGGSFGVGGPK